ncbi:uncharacterized protein ACMZJ9_014384 [Mantella aurantiaca]
MEKDKSQMTGRILNITLEIIYLLTGEDYVPSKKTIDDTPSSSHSLVSEGSSWKQSPLTKPESNDKRILQLTNKITELLTGEVPVRCQDVAIYLSMEEWEYYDGHKDLYTDAMMEGQQFRCLEGEIMYDDIKAENSPIEIVAWPIPQTEEPTPCNPSERPGRSVSNESDDSSVSDDEDDDDDDTDDDDDDGDNDDDDGGGEDLLNAKFNNDPHPTPSLQPAQPQKFYNCSECSMLLSSKSHMVRHQRLHKKKKLTCSQCGKVFPHKAHLIRHQCVHTKEKDYYICSQCGMTFPFRSHLFTHLRVHTGEKALVCQDCGKHFSCNSALITHRRMHTGEKPYRCHECGKEYVQKHSLMIHKKFHAEGKPFSCPECGEKFFRQSHLDNHRKTHKSMRRYSCPDCGDFFKLLSSLINHQKIHNAEKLMSS